MMNTLTVLTTFPICWVLIEITVFLSSKSTIPNDNQLSYQSFIWFLRLVAGALLIGLIIFMDLLNDFDVKSRMFVCVIF